MESYYVYVLKLPDGRVFYVGKGSRDRMHHHQRVIARPALKENQRPVLQTDASTPERTTVHG